MNTFSCMWSPEKDIIVPLPALLPTIIARCHYTYFRECQVIVMNISSDLIKASLALPGFCPTHPVVEREEGAIGMLGNIMFQVKSPKLPQ